KLPTGTDFRFYSSYSSFRGETQKLSQRILEMLDHMCGFMNSKQKLANAKDSIEKREIFEDISDHCFEQIDISLDQIRSLQKNKELKKNEDKIIGTKEQRSKRKEWSSKSLRTLRPQTEFFDDIDNSINTPFKSKLLKKPNSLQKLQSESQLKNPYAFEIDQFKYYKWQLKRREPIMYRPLKETAIYWVNTTAQLTEMIDHIVSEFELSGNNKFNGIGVDLRYDNIHSYQGMSCVLQISTRSEDFLIDALELRRVLQQLNIIFTNPNIVKVFYQSKQHLLALQRDLGIYVVNLFDIYESTKIIKLTFSFSSLLSHFCNYHQHQQHSYLEFSDWRMRPLRLELTQYARIQTHYLLYLWD
ncbi:hypothetical protein RFI_29756, partial [Reticulomyxa filosa]